jgi:hypothetical protein
VVLREELVGVADVREHGDAEGSRQAEEYDVELGWQEARALDVDPVEAAQSPGHRIPHESRPARTAIAIDDVEVDETGQLVAKVADPDRRTPPPLVERVHRDKEEARTLPAQGGTSAGGARFYRFVVGGPRSTPEIPRDPPTRARTPRGSGRPPRS